MDIRKKPNTPVNLLDLPSEILEKILYHVTSVETRCVSKAVMSHLLSVPHYHKLRVPHPKEVVPSAHDSQIVGLIRGGYRNVIIDGDWVPSLTPFLASMTNMQSLRLRVRNIENFSFLTSMTSLKKLSIFYSDHAGSQADLFDVLPPNLEKLALSLCKLNTQVVLDHMAQALQTLPKLTEVHLCGTKLDDTAITALAASLPTHLRGLSLDFGTCKGLTHTGFGTLVQALQHMPHLKLLSFMSTRLSECSAFLLAARLPQCLVSLDITGTAVSPASIRAIAENLPSTLQYLQMGNLKCLDLPAAVALSKRFKSHLCKLRQLWVTGLLISQGVAATVLESLPHSLEVLSISYNCIDNAAAQALGRCLPSLTRLWKFRCNNCNLAGLVPLFLHKMPQSMTVLVMNHSSLALEEAKFLARHMPPSLEYLDLEGNAVGFEGMIELAKSMPSNLRFVHMASNWNSGVAAMEGEYEMLVEAGVNASRLMALVKKMPNGQFVRMSSLNRQSADCERPDMHTLQWMASE